MMRSKLLFIAVISSLFLQCAIAAGTQLRLEISDANEPYSASVLSVDGFFVSSQVGLASQVLKFSSLVPGHYTIDVRFSSGHEYTRTIEVPANNQVDTLRVSISRKDAFYAKDLADAAHGVSVHQLGSEEYLISAVKRFERALRDEDLERAEEILSDAMEEAPKAALAWNNLGALRLQQNRIDDALVLLRHAYLLDPGSFESNVNLARAFALKGKLDESIEYARKALEIRPNHPSALSLMAGALFLAGMREEALPYLETLEQMDPEHVCRPKLLLAAIYQERGELIRAARYVLDFVEAHPTFADAEALEARANTVLAASASNPGQ